jgi:hypothetical protein
MDISPSTGWSISQKAGNKNELKMPIKKGLNVIINVTQGNYPDTYKQ